MYDDMLVKAPVLCDKNIVITFPFSRFCCFYFMLTNINGVIIF